ncbi:TM2 domain-containing protein [Yunchengibacter salinarum]|uniref:TM2 domain-containing protein n=1 Tax=Yunchengibacter salinarum TaxID=3133399 RepID=UPI0035B68561
MNRQSRVSDDARAMMEFESRRKSVLVAYLLWFFLGGFGVHRFYLGATFSGFVMLAVAGVSFLTMIILIGHLGMLFIGLWWLVDALLIPGLTQRYNARLARTIG